MNEERLMNINEACKYLSISKSMLYKIVEEGEIGYYKLGNRIRFRQGMLEAWLKARLHKVTK